MLKALYMSSEVVQQAVLAQAKVLNMIADKGSCVIVGRAADYVLKDRKNVLSIFCYAPDEYRISKITEMYGDTREEALKSMESSDASRSSYYASISGQQWKDPHNYDLCLDCSCGVDEASKKILSYINS